jgi:rod shape-determining protein MreD
VTAPGQPNTGLMWRLAVLGFVVSVLQLAVVGQITIIGVNFDLLPLVIAFVGLLCGSLPGAVFGFAVGLLVDAALLETMGISSLAYLAAGYGAGRLAELRDPQGALTPVAVGAASTAVVSIGFSLLRFLLLGQEAPVSYLLVGQTVLAVVVNAVIALPVYAATRRWLAPSMPDDPRRRRRRAYTTSLSPLSRA